MLAIRVRKAKLVVGITALGVLASVGLAQAATGVVQAVIAGALTAPMGASSDGRLSLRLAVDRPVSLVSGGAVVPGVIGTATFAQLSDNAPYDGFGPSYTVMVFRLPGVSMLTAAGVSTRSGFVTTFSSTEPYARLRGNWTLTSGVGVSGASARDALVTFTFDSDPDSNAPPASNFAAKGAVRGRIVKTISGLATVDVRGDVPVKGDQNAPLALKDGLLASYTIYDIVASTERVELNAIAYQAGIYVVSVCAPEQPTSQPTCLVGGSGGVTLLTFSEPDVTTLPVLPGPGEPFLPGPVPALLFVSDLSGELRQIGSPELIPFLPGPSPGIVGPGIIGPAIIGPFSTIQFSSTEFTFAVVSLGQAGVAVTPEDLILKLEPSDP